MGKDRRRLIKCDLYMACAFVIVSSPEKVTWPLLGKIQWSTRAGTFDDFALSPRIYSLCNVRYLDV